MISLFWVTIQFHVTWLGKMVECLFFFFAFLQCHFLDVFLNVGDVVCVVVVPVICLKNADWNEANTHSTGPERRGLLFSFFPLLVSVYLSFCLCFFSVLLSRFDLISWVLLSQGPFSLSLSFSVCFLSPLTVVNVRTLIKCRLIFWTACVSLSDCVYLGLLRKSRLAH